MYESSPDFSNLRQGDVISNIQLPRYSIKGTSFLHKIDTTGEWKYQERAIFKSLISNAVVLSQCCEFNEGKRNAFSLAELLPFKYFLKNNIKKWGINIAQLIPLSKSPFRASGTDHESLEKLRRANIIDITSERNEALNVFLFEDDGEYLKEPHVADFTRVFSLIMKDKEYILKNKILQLEKEVRRHFQIKLAYFYCRPAE